MLARTERRPPPILATALGGVLLGAILLGDDRATPQPITRAVPLWTLVAAQAFRFPLELAMHRAAVARVMPMALSLRRATTSTSSPASARSCVAALVAADRAPRALVIAWNVIGLGCLAVIVVVAAGTMPGNFLAGDVPNTWVCYVPFVWLPTVLVPAAFAGHLLVFRKLATSRRAAGAA